MYLCLLNTAFSIDNMTQISYHNLSLLTLSFMGILTHAPPPFSWRVKLRLDSLIYFSAGAKSLLHRAEPVPGSCYMCQNYFCNMQRECDISSSTACPPFLHLDPFILKLGSVSRRRSIKFVPKHLVSKHIVSKHLVSSPETFCRIKVFGSIK